MKQKQPQKSKKSVNLEINEPLFTTTQALLSFRRIHFPAVIKIRQ